MNQMLRRISPIWTSMSSATLAVKCFMVILGCFCYSIGTAQIDAPKRDTLFYDANGNELANPSDSIRYILVLKNGSTSGATMITVPNGTDPNTNLRPSSILTSPLASNDGPYAVTGNVGIAVPSGSGVLVNDFDDDIGALSINGVGMPFSSAEGGSITIASDGSFNYTPPPGFTGRDSALYTVTDGTPAPNCPATNDAWIIFEISDMIWFVNENVSGGGNNGTLADPFETLAAFEAVNGTGGNNPAANQPIFVYSSVTSYSGGVTLENGQQLLGQGMTTNLATATGITLPMHSSSFPGVNMTNPVIRNTMGNAITLGSGNDLRGLNVGTNMTPSTSSGIVGTNVGNLMVSEDVNAYAMGGSAVSITTGGTLAVTLGTVVSTSSTATGMNFIGVAGGSVSAAAVTVTSSTSSGVNIGTSSAAFQFTSLSATNTASGAGGFNMSGGGTIAIEGGSISVGNASAVNIAGSTITMTGVTFGSVTANGSFAAPGQTAISLMNTGTGPFTSNGGTIENILDVDAVRLDNTGGLVALNNMIIEDIAASGDIGAAIGTRSGVDGIHGQNVMAGLSMNGTTMRRFSDNAINGALFGDGISSTNWNGLTLTNCNISLSNRYHVAGRGDDNSEGTIRIVGLYGTVSVTGCTFTDGAAFLELFTHTSNNLDMTVQGSTFTRTLKEFGCPGVVPIVNVGKRGISVEVNGSADAVVRIGDPAEVNDMLGNTFTDNGTASVVVYHNTGATGGIDVVISQNDFIVTDHLTGPVGCPGGSMSFNFPQGGVSLNPGGGTFEAILSNNLFDEVMHAAGGIGQFTMTADDNGSSEFIVRGNTFMLPWDAAVRVLADGNGDCAMLFENNTYVSGMVGGPADDVGFSTPSPYQGFLVAVRNNGGLDLTLKDEDLPPVDVGDSFEAETQASGGTLNLYLDGCDAPDDYDLDQTGGTFNLYSEMGCPMVVAAIVSGNGNTGTVSSSGTITCNTTAPTLPMITIPLLASRVGEGIKSGNISDADLKEVKEEATKILGAIASSEQYQKLGQVELVVADLPNRELANYFAGVIKVDRDAAGHGWSLGIGAETGKNRKKGMDLLTVLVHEYLHALNLPHASTGIMASELESGTRWSFDLLPQKLLKE